MRKDRNMRVKLLIVSENFLPELKYVMMWVS